MSRAPTYTHAPKPYGRRITLRLDPHAIVVDDGIQVSRVALADVAMARLTFKPNNAFMRGFVCTLTTREGRTLAFSNLSWRSFVASENLAGPYVRFLGALLPAIAAHNPACRFVAGRPKAVWFVSTLVAAGLIVGLGVLVAALVRDRLLQSAAIAAILTLLMGWLLVDMTTRNRPRPFEPAHPPADLMPVVKASDGEEP